ncbi:XRN 5-3 exoribonuclease, partial [uncultured virus]
VGEGRTAAVRKEDYPVLTTDCLACVKSIVNHYKPKKLVYIAVDGPLPMAKIQESRERRYADATVKGRDDYSGSSLITPGTDFMDELHEKFLELDNNDYRVEKLIYSSHLVPGEGEHKIMKYIREHKAEIDMYPGNKILYGNDSDLILLGLCSKVDSMYVCNDSVTLLDAKGFKVKDAYDNSEFSIDLLRDALNEEIGPDREDEFIFSISLIGNDFLPRSAIMSDIVAGMSAIITFLASGKSSIDNGGLDLFAYLTKQEVFSDNTLLDRLYDKSRNIDNTDYPSKIFERVALEADEMDDAFRYHWYTKLLLYQNYNTDSLQTIAKACVEYIKGMYWVLDYYTLGQDKVTWLWYYPYHHAPLFSDLAETVRAIDDGRILGGAALYDDTVPVKDEVRFTALHQLISVVPQQSLRFIPPELHAFYLPSSPLFSFMTLSVMVNNELTEVEGQVRYVLPKIDYYTVMEALASRSFKATTIEKYKNGYDVTRNKPLRSRPAPRPVKDPEGATSRVQEGTSRAQAGAGRYDRRSERDQPQIDVDTSKYSRQTSNPERQRYDAGSARGKKYDSSSKSSSRGRSDRPAPTSRR